MRKEYNNRWDAPLVNPGFTLAEYEAKRDAQIRDDAKMIAYVEGTLGRAFDQEAYFQEVKARSEGINADTK